MRHALWCLLFWQGLCDPFTNFLTEGDDFANQGQIVSARASYASASKLRPSAHEPYFSLGFAECSVGNVKECETAFARVDALMPSKTEAQKFTKARQMSAAYLSLAEAHSRTPNWDSVHNFSRTSLQLDNASEWAPRAAWRLGEALEAFATKLGGGWTSNPFGLEALEVYNTSIHLPEFASTDSSIRAMCYLGLAVSHLRMGNMEEAKVYLRQGLDEEPDEHDARMALSHLVNIFMWEGDTATAQTLIADAIERKVWERPDQTPPYFLPGLANVAAWPEVARYPAIGRQIRLLEEATAKIKTEMLGLLELEGPEGLSYGTMEVMAVGGGARGSWHTKTIDCCKARESTPQTCEVLDQVKQHGEVFNAQFLRLEPHGVIRSHCGANSRWVMHLGLRTSEAAQITVGGVTKSWQEGKVLLFDDSFRHSVVNGATDRVVLALQIANPEYDKLQPPGKPKKKEL